MEANTMMKRMILMLVAAGLVFGGIFAFQSFKAAMIKKAMAGLAAPPQTVATMTAGYQEWQPQLESVGSLVAVNGTNISLQLAGLVAEIDFNSGDDVKKGTRLLRLQDEDQVAKLHSLQATAALARITYERDLRQLRAQAVSQQTVDSDLWTLKSDEAQVTQQQAMVDYETLVAPFDGRLGVRQVDLGQYLAAGTTVVTLQALDPIYVDFYLPQQALAQVKVGEAVTAKIDTYPSESFPGVISAVNPLIDTSTRNVLIRATLKNPEHKLLPGMFASVDIAAGAPQRQITLAQTAISYTSYGDTVYILEDKGKNGQGQPDLVARQVFVTTGATRGDRVAVLSGVREGDVVVTSGQLKLHSGSPVIVNNSVRPTDDADPRPADHL
jgi:membrane fusion protein, multidrug efflux system